ncbi:MAG TPA: penicillin-binding protein 2, partial [Clostridiales bacterium]|nr:penicillin-binding protein 2 [Clostridiales bacterium]
MISKKHNESQKDTNQSIYNIIYIFMGLFLLLIIYFIIFLTVKSDEVINNTYNKRQGVLAERIIRGDILSADGDVLARTVMDEEGIESREYPYGEIFAHVVGRASKGMSGIEQTENIRLLTSDINTFEKMYHELSNIKSPGNHVITTLDSNLSQIAYDALGDNRGAVVVMEPSTGKILVMVSKPSYDPNRIDELWEDFMNDEGDDSPLLNRATQGLYSPGSTFKVLT